MSRLEIIYDDQVMVDATASELTLSHHSDGTITLTATLDHDGEGPYRGPNPEPLETSLGDVTPGWDK